MPTKKVTAPPYAGADPTLQRNPSFEANDQRLSSKALKVGGGLDDIAGSKQNTTESKLMNNLDALANASNNLSEGLRKQKQEVDEKKRQAELKQQEATRQIEGKLQETITENERMKKLLLEKRMRLKQVEELSSKTKTETLNLKELQQKMAEEMAMESDAKIKQLMKDIDDRGNEATQIKDDIKKARLLRKELEEKIEMQEEKNLMLSEQLNNLGKDIQQNKSLKHTASDFEKEKSNLVRLKDKMAQLKAYKDQLYSKNMDLQQQQRQTKANLEEQLVLAKSNPDVQAKRRDLQAQLERLKSSNKKLFETNMSLVNTLQSTQMESQKQETKRLELTEIANLLKDQNKFEKLSRQIQTRIEDMEDKQRELEDNYKAIDNNLAIFKDLTQQQNNDLENDTKEFSRNLVENVKQKDNIKDSIFIVMGKVCNKAPSELNVDMIDQHFKDLEEHEKRVDDTDDSLGEMDHKMNQILKKCFFDFEKQLMYNYMHKSEEVSKDNEDEMIKIGGNQSSMNEKLNKLEQTVLEKSSQVDVLAEAIDAAKNEIAKARKQNKYIFSQLEEEKLVLQNIKNFCEDGKSKLMGLKSDKMSLENYITNLDEYVGTYKQCEEQRIRLEQLKQDDLKQFEEKLHQIANQIQQMEENAMGNKVENCHRLIDNGKEKARDIEKEILALEDKLKLLKVNAAKVDPVNEKEINDDINNAQKNLERLRNQKDQFLRELENIQQQPGADILNYQKNISDILNQINGLANRDLKEREREIDGIEIKLRQQIREKRLEQRKECNENMEKCKSNLTELQKMLERIKSKIEVLSKDALQIERAHNYKDCEREKQAREQLSDPIEEKRSTLQKLHGEKENLQEACHQVQVEFEQLTQKLIAIPTITAEGEGDTQQDEVAFQWKNCTQKSKEHDFEIQRTLDKAINMLDHLDTLGQIYGEMMDKYKFKNQIYKDCLQKEKLKQDYLNRQQDNLQALQRKLATCQDNLKKVIFPKNEDLNLNFIQDVHNQEKDLTINVEQLDKLLAKREKLQTDLTNICQTLPLIGSQVVTTKELQQIKDDLDKLDLDSNYLSEEIKNIDQEIEDQYLKVNSILTQNKKILADEDELNVQDLDVDLSDLEKVHQETAEKMKEYNVKIKNGLWSDDQELRKQLKALQEEAEGIERDMKALERQKGNLRNQERLHKDQFQTMKSNPKKSSVYDFQVMGENFKKDGEEAKELIKQYQGIQERLNKKIKNLDDYMVKYNELIALYGELDTMVNDIKKNFKNFQSKLIDGNDMANQLDAVLKEMHLGVDRDYKLKDVFIKQEQEELSDVKNTLTRLEQMVESFKPKLKAIQQRGNEQLDTEELQQVLSNSSELLEEMESADAISSSCNQRLKQIKSDISDADVPVLTKQREQEIVEFSSKLRQAEQDVYDLRKQLATSKGVENSKEIEDELREIDDKIQRFKVLEDLNVLKTVIAKLRNLGNELQGSFDGMSELEYSIQKIKRDIGGMDLTKRYQNQKKLENDQRGRLENIKSRLERIEKGALDCDGYTSNTEEATFIETLLNEIPEMKQKEYEAKQECEDINSQLEILNREIEKAASPEADEAQVMETSAKLEDVEEQTQLNEKTVVFLEKLMDKLEDHFMNMDVKKKLDKRHMELNELSNICKDFEDQLTDMQDHLVADIERIDEKKKQGVGLAEMMVDEFTGKPMNLLEEIGAVQTELQSILIGVSNLQERNRQIRDQRDQAQNDFADQVLRKSPYKDGHKITNKHDVFSLLRANGWIKKRIVDMIKSLKEVSKRMREHKMRYQLARNRIEKSKPKKLYKAVKGDIVDEMFADYINKLNCPVPIKRLGNNQYTFGTKKIFAKIINGKLVIRVGGGYMGIEEFMMYYGQQELTKLQKQEMMNLEDGEHDLFSGIEVGDGQDDENAEHVDIDVLKAKIKEQSAQKKKSMLTGGDEEEKATVVGIGDVRKALKKNLVEIKTYEEHSSLGKSHNYGSRGGGKKTSVPSDSNVVEKHLRAMEKNIEKNLNTEQSEGGQTTSSKRRKLGSSGSAMRSRKSGNVASNKNDMSQDEGFETRTKIKPRIAPMMRSPRGQQSPNRPKVHN